MNELNYTKAELARLYDQLETLVTKYNQSHSSDELYRELSGVVYTVDGPNDALSNGGKSYHCKGGTWHGQWQDDAS
jgi:hypothetical protein